MIPIQSHVCSALLVPVLQSDSQPDGDAPDTSRALRQDTVWQHVMYRGTDNTISILCPADTCPFGSLFEIWASVNSYRFVLSGFTAVHRVIMSSWNMCPGKDLIETHLIPSSNEMMWFIKRYESQQLIITLAPKPITWRMNGLLIVITDVSGQHTWVTGCSRE